MYRYRRHIHMHSFPESAESDRTFNVDDDDDDVVVVDDDASS